MLLTNLVFSYFVLIAPVQALPLSAKEFPTSVPLGYDGMASISRVFCNDATYVTPYVKEALDLGCRRKNWKQSKLINRVTGLVLRVPRVFNPKNKQDAFEIPGNPYLMTAFDYQRRNIRS
ncbi:hypothetical protein HI914_02671 [Erysiphe necator]|nr:hypothetical protein HI914_02671 [Erysiphe necator]